MCADVAEVPTCRSAFQHRRIVAAAFRTAIAYGRIASITSGGISDANSELRIATSGNVFSNALAKPIHIHQSQADTPVRVDAARPIRLLHINRSEADAVALRVFHQRRGMIETHQLIVQERG